MIDLASSLARARKTAAQLDPLGAALKRARSVAKSLGSPATTTRKDPGPAAGGAPVAAGGAPDPSASGNLTSASFAQAGAIPPDSGIPRRRKRPVIAAKDYTGSAPPDGATSLADAPVPVAVAIDAIPEPMTLVFQGLAVCIDRPAGFTQVKVDEAGAVLWTRTYTCNYGYLPDTCGGDAEELDVFVGPDSTSEDVWWFYILDCAGNFDEYKLVLGCIGEDAARKIILDHIPPQFVAPSAAYTTIDQVKALLGQEPMARESALLMVSKALDAGERSFRLEKALKSVAAFASRAPNQSMIEAPPNFDHPALTMPLSGTYPDPDAVGGWLGWIEPNETAEAPRSPAVGVGAGRYSENGFGDWIAFVGVDGRTLLWTEREPDGGVIGAPYAFQRPDLATEGKSDPLASRTFKMVQVGKAAPQGEEERYVLGVVLVPEETDLQGEVCSAEVIRESAFEWLAKFQNFDLDHKVFINRAVSVVESYLAPQDLTINGQAVKQGTWLLGVIIEDLDLWAAIKRGEYTGFSINGLSRKVELTR